MVNNSNQSNKPQKIFFLIIILPKALYNQIKISKNSQKGSVINLTMFYLI